METYLNLTIRRQAILERLKSGEVRNFASEIRKIERLVRSALNGLEGELSDLPRTQLNRFLSQLKRDQAEVYRAGVERFLSRADEIAAVYLQQEILDLSRTTDVRRTTLASFTNKDLFRRVRQRPLQTDGNLLEPWIRNFTETETNRVNNVIRRGHANGLTNRELTNQVLGTRGANQLDGQIARVRRNASTVVRTSIQHVASSARQELWENNQDVVSRYSFIATLDSDTSKICRTLDQQEFEFGKGPIPPVHPNCRSTTIPILSDEFSFLSRGRTRSSMPATGENVSQRGAISANSSYYDWLNNQNEQTQIDVLGRDRARLFRDGGLTRERFRELQFNSNFEPLTLAEMRELEPEAFEMAGL